MSRPRVEDFLIDDENEAKFWTHGLSARQVLQTLDNEHVLVPNRRRRRARMLFIGRDRGGTCIAIPIEPTHTPGVWRPITAWRCKDVEGRKLEGGGSGHG